METFLWGVATSAYQVEGGIEHCDWSEFEGTLQGVEGAGEACGHYEHALEDIRLVRQAGFSAYRFSLEWSRIEPSPGRFDEEAIAHYRDMVLLAHAEDLEPIVTLHHFTLPIWLSRRGGVMAPDFTGHFERFAEKVGGEIDARFWVTINEPMILAVMGYLDGSWPPGKRSLADALRAARSLARAHRAAYRVLKRRPGRRVGIAKHLTVFQPYRPNRPLDRLGARVQDRLFNRWFFSLVGGTLDFVGINYYARTYARGLFGTCRSRPGEVVSQMGWVADAEDFRTVLQRARILEIPILITENGIATEDDDVRERYIKDHVRVVLQERAEVGPIFGYLYWSLWDNFEWREGWRPMFGIAPRPEGGERLSLRPSGELLAEIARTDGASLNPEPGSSRIKEDGSESGGPLPARAGPPEDPRRDPRKSGRGHQDTRPSFWLRKR